MNRYMIPRLGSDPDSPFPDPGLSEHPEGLVAWGGDLDPQRLLRAYRAGIFPWYSDGSPILWWSPEPRAVMVPGQADVSRRLARTLRQGRFCVSMDLAFAEVIDGCAEARADDEGTWITPALRSAFIELHGQGHAHSFEVWMDGELAGGLYGLALGKIFFAESKFHRRRDASKIALVLMLRALKSWGFLLLDCQIWNPHLERLGVRLLDGARFRQVLTVGTSTADVVGPWTTRLEDWGKHTRAARVLDEIPIRPDATRQQQGEPPPA